MSDQENETPQSDEQPDVGNQGNAPRRKKLPHELTQFKKWVLRFADLIFVIASLFLAWLCVAYFQTPQLLPSCLCWAYLGFGAALAALFVDRFLRHQKFVHKARLEDPSEVESMFVEARNVEPRLHDPVRPDEYDERVENLTEEVSRLEQLGYERWTEYQLLPLNRMLVDFLKVDDLKADAQSNLAVLEDYSQDYAYPYKKEIYDKWETRIDVATNQIKNDDASPTERDLAAEPLRAELRMLLEHVAEYEANWAKGSAVVRTLMICVATAVPILLVAGILPYYYPVSDGSLGIFNWGFLGIGGSLTAVLLALYKSNRVEVGNTEGKNELWRAVLGATLGLVAGILIYSLILGDLFPKSVVPDLQYQKARDLGLSIVWAVGAGVLFERVFDRLRWSFEENIFK